MYTIILPNLLVVVASYPLKMSKNFCKFTKKQDEILIELVSQHPALFNANSEHYKDSIVRENIWAEIATEIGKNGTYTRIILYIGINN